MDSAFSLGYLQASGSPSFVPDGPWPGSQCAALTSAGGTYGGFSYFRLNPLNLGSMSASTGFSICMWFAFDATSSDAAVFDFGSDGNSVLRLSRSGTSAQLQLRYSSSYCGSYNFMKPIIIGQWRHVCVVNQGSSWSAYDDGLLEFSWFPYCTGSLNNSKLTSNFIGRSNSYSASLLIGRVDEFRIYQKPLSSNNVSSIYSMRYALPGLSSSLISSVRSTDR